MKRHSVLAASLVIAALLIGGLSWVLGTPGGARLAFSLLSRSTSLRIHAGMVEGSLSGDLRLENLTVGWPTGKATSASFHLRWHPQYLLEGRLQIELLSAKGLEIWEKGHKKGKAAAPFKFSWPDLSGFPSLLRARIERLKVSDLDYHSGSGPPVRLNRLQAKLSWRGGILAIRQLQAEGPAGSLQGEVAAGFVKPSVHADLVADLHRNTLAKHLSVSLALAAPRAGAPLAGTLETAVVPASKRLFPLKLTAVLTVQKSALVVHRFRLESPQQKGAVSGHGTLDLSGSRPTVDLLAALKHLDLAAVGGVATDLSGTLKVTGSLDRYQGHFALANQAQDWKAIKLSGPFSGRAEGLSFPDLKGRWLKGRLGGKFTFGWGKGIAIRGSLRAQGLDPAVVRSDWSGRINATVSGDYRRGKNQEATAELQGDLRDSTLRGRRLNGELRVRLDRRGLALERAVLQGEGFKASARGQLRQRLSLKASVTRLAGLVPGAGGTLHASGWLRRAAGQWSGALSGEADGLSYRDLKVGHLTLGAERTGKKGYLKLNVAVRNFAKGKIIVSRADVAAHGLLSDHAIRCDAHWSKGEIHAAAAGGYAAGIWKGKLEQLAGRTVQTGGWQLLSPVELTLSSRRLQVLKASFRSEQGEELVVSADIAPNPWRGSVRTSWHSIRLGHANGLFPDLTLSGHSSGQVELHLLPEGHLKLAAKIDLSGKLSRSGLVMDIHQAKVTAEGGQKGLSASMEIDLADGGHLGGASKIQNRFALSFRKRARWPSRGRRSICKSFRKCCRGNFISTGSCLAI